jgi:hypothetical protein
MLDIVAFGLNKDVRKFFCGDATTTIGLGQMDTGLAQATAIDIAPEPLRAGFSPAR